MIFEDHRICRQFSPIIETFISHALFALGGIIRENRAEMSWKVEALIFK